MPKKKSRLAPDGDAERQAVVLDRVLADLESEDESRRANAVRQLCPCRTNWLAPVERYVWEMIDDPSERVREAADHVLFEELNDHRRRPAPAVTDGTVLKDSRRGKPVPRRLQARGFEDEGGALARGEAALPEPPGASASPRPRVRGWRRAQLPPARRG